MYTENNHKFDLSYEDSYPLRVNQTKCIFNCGFIGSKFNIEEHEKSCKNNKLKINILGTKKKETINVVKESLDIVFIGNLFS